MILVDLESCAVYSVFEQLIKYDISILINIYILFYNFDIHTFTFKKG